MKKLLLLITVGLVAGGVNAQEAQNVSVVRTGGVEYKSKRAVVDPRIEAANQQIAATKAARAMAPTSANKTTAAATRLYNWSDYLKNIRTMAVTNPYMWYNANGMGIYSNGTGGLTLDTINFETYGIVIVPWGTQFNDAGVTAYNGQMAMNQSNTYTIDSVATYGFYGRNPAKPAVVDTMIFGVVYNRRSWSYWGSTATNAGAGDTLRCASMAYDVVNHTADTTGGYGLKVVKKFLTIADSSATRIVKEVGLSVPANQFIGCAVTFKTGDPAFVPYADTVFAGSANATTPFKYGMFRPAFYEETGSQYMSYIKGSYNTGYTKFFPNESTSGYYKEYVPTYAYVEAAYNMEWPDIDFIVTCAAPFATVGIENVSNIIAGVNVYPNPATSEVNVKFNLNSTSNANVSVKNVMGQVIATQNMGSVANGTATFSTANLTNGVYFCTVESNGQQQTSRFVVAH